MALEDKFFLYLSEPLNAKLILEIYEQKQVTTTQLSEKFNEIPQATLYRRLQKMLADNILKIASENHIRGTVEKVYSLSLDIDESKQQLYEANNGEAYMSYIMHYMMGILQEFQKYTAKENINLKDDGIGFSIAPIYATHEELQEARVKIGEIFTSLHNNKPSEGRKLHNLCIITTPPKD